MADDWSGLGFNPTPGHPHLATNLADHLKGTANVLKDTHTLLDSLSKESSHWKGKAHSAFTEKISDLPKYLRDAKDSLRAAGKEVQSWSDSLQNMKSKAKNLEEDAKEARAGVERAGARYKKARTDPDLKLGGTFFESQAEADSAQSRLDVAEGELSEAWKKLEKAQQKLQQLIDSAETLERDHGDTAQRHADKIREHAENHAPDSGFLDKFSDWWDDHGGDLLTVAATIVGIAAIFVPVLAPAAMGLSLAAASQHVYQYSKSGKDMWPPTSSNLAEWATIGGDVLGAVPGVGPACKGAKAAISAGRASKAVTGSTKVLQASKAGVQEFKAVAGAPGSPSIVTGVPVQKAAKVLGASDEAALMSGKISEATTTGTLGAPTAMTLWDSSDATTTAAERGTKAATGIGIAEEGYGHFQKISKFAKAL